MCSPVLKKKVHQSVQRSFYEAKPDSGCRQKNRAVTPFQFKSQRGSGGAAKYFRAVNSEPLMKVKDDISTQAALNHRSTDVTSWF